MAQHNILNSRVDSSGTGIILDSHLVNLPANESFESTMKDALNMWVAQRKKAIWFRVDIIHSTWISALVNLGFKYHHAREEYAMMIKWLPLNEVNNIPMFAHTLIGIMAIVINDRNEVLVVTENYDDQPKWTLPKAFSELEENFQEVAVREVYEQTGVASEYKSIIAFTYGLGSKFGCSYMYCVMQLKCVCMNHMRIGEGSNIAETRWMPIREFLLNENVTTLDRWYVQKYIDCRNTDVVIDAKFGIHEHLKTPYAVYHVVQSSQDGGDGASGGSNLN